MRFSEEKPSGFVPLARSPVRKERKQIQDEALLTHFQRSFSGFPTHTLEQPRHFFGGRRNRLKPADANNIPIKMLKERL